MAEELSPESKLYVKEEIEKIRKEFKDELKEAQSKSTKIFGTVVLIVGLLASLGVIHSARGYTDAAVENAVEKEFGKEALERFDEQRVELEEDLKKAEGFVADSNDAYREIAYILEKARKGPNDLLISTLKLQQLASAEGYAWIGGIAFIWGTRTSTSDATEPFNIGFNHFPNACFTVITSLPGEVNVVTNQKQFTLDRINGYTGKHKFTFVAIGY